MAGELERLLIRVEADTAQLRRALANADKGVADFANKVDRSASRVEGRFKSLMAGFSAAYLVREAVRLSDTFVLMNNRLAVVTKSSKELAYVQDQLFSAAQNTRLDVTELNELYARMAFALKDVGVSTNDVLKLTENLSKATIVSGASTAEAAGALRQLSQGLAAGTLRGQELNSVMEQLPFVAGMVADRMGVTIGQLRKLGEEGKLTGKEVFAAILAATDEIDAKFAKTTPTVSQGVTQMNNALLGFVGRASEASGAGTALAQTFKSIADNVELATKHITRGKSIWESIGGGGGSVWEGFTKGESIWAGAAKQNSKGIASRMRGGVFDDSSSFDPNAKGVDRTPAAADPWAASIIPPSAEEQLREMKDAWDELHESQLTTLDDLIGDKAETAAAKMAALTAAVKDGSITWRDYSDGVADVKAQTERANDDMLSSTTSFLDTMFQNNKMAATASALINTYQGITKALSAYPPPYSTAMAAMQAAMGFAQVRAINSTSKSSRGGGSAGGAVSSGAAASAAPAAAAAAPQQDRALTVRMSSMGELIGRRGLRELMEQIVDAQRDGYRVVLG